MKLSSRARYGMRAILELGIEYGKEPLQIKTIADREDISNKYLEQLIIPLKRAKLIQSVRGPKGGHLLAKPPREISIGEVVEVLEGGIDLSVCVGDADACGKSEECLIRATWEEASRAMYRKLDSVSLLKVIKSKKHG